VASTMKVEVAGKLTREEEKKDEEDNSMPAWGSVKKGGPMDDREARKFPTLAKTIKASSNINIDDGSDPTVNISVSKNVFSALEDEEDDEEKANKRPKEIKPSMVTKKKGERETEAIQREVDRYATKPKKKKPEAVEEESEEESEDEDVEEVTAKPAAEAPKKKAGKKQDAAPAKATEVEEKKPKELEAEVDWPKIQADPEAIVAKYTERKKPFPAKPIPREEKENKPRQAQAKQFSKKKKNVMEEEDYDKPKLAFWED